MVVFAVDVMELAEDPGVGDRITSAETVRATSGLSEFEHQLTLRALKQASHDEGLTDLLVCSLKYALSIGNPSKPRHDCWFPLK